MPIERDLDVDHTRLGATHHHDIVEGDEFLRRAVDLDISMQHRALVDPAVTVEIESNLLLHLVWLKLRQEADTPEIDAQDRDLQRSAEPRDRDDRAIAAQ